MIVQLTSLSLLLLIFCTKISQAETMYYTAEELRGRNIESLKIRNDLHLKCTNAPIPQKPTSTPKPTTTNPINHDCNDKLSLETTTKKLHFGKIPTRSPMYSYFQSKIEPPRETLQDVNLYCQLLEKAFKQREQPPPTIPMYNNEEKLHFTDNPLLRSETTPVPPMITKPCKNDSPIINIPKRPSCEQTQEQISNINNFYKLVSLLSAPVRKPLKNICPTEENSYLEENPIKVGEASNSDLQNKMYNSLRLNNYPDTDLKVMQYLNMFPNNLEYRRPILRNRRNSPINGQEVNFADEVSERLPIEEFSINDRIIGGTLVHSKEVPYQVALYNLDYFICGSSLISKFYILTAGHCLDHIKASDLWIRVGSEHLLKGGATYKVSDYTVHPNYNTTDFDIAIIRSASPIKIGPAVMPIALPSFADPDLPDNTEVTGSGWGAVERKRNKKATYTLHKIVLLTVDRQSCRDRIMASKNKIGIRQICTNLPLKAGMCFGDSGGPLVANKKLVGIVSWGSPCAIGDADVYTNVQEFLPWIYCEMKKLDYKYSNEE